MIEVRIRPDIVPGAVFPDHELSDHRGMRRALSELQGGEPLVLVLSRGGFCPKDRRQHLFDSFYTTTTTSIVWWLTA